MSYSLDVEQFIREIEKRPVIWDFNCEDNRHKNRKQRAWDDIARLFIENYNDMTALEKMEVYRKLHGKWRNIRDSYVRDTKKSVGHKRYMYAKHLTFLNHLYKHDTQTDDDDCSDDGDTKKRTHSNGHNDTDCWQSESENSVEDTKRKKIKKEENPLDYLEAAPLLQASCNLPMEDEDRSFFDSLLPAVRGFDLDQKLEFRSEVISLIRNIRKGQKNMLEIHFDAAGE